MTTDFLMKNRLILANDNDFSMSEICKNDLKIVDKSYLQFIYEYINGGYFFKGALLIYPHSTLYSYPNIQMLNDCLKKEYENIFEQLIAFGQDIFGNQFCFEENSSKIYYFNIEDGRKTVLANNFDEWLSLIEKEFEYYSGVGYLERWIENHTFPFEARLCAKIPFVVGGEFNNSNFYISHFPKYIKANAAIAKQVYNLPDGTQIKIKIVN